MNADQFAGLLLLGAAMWFFIEAVAWWLYIRKVWKADASRKHKKG